jgi:thiol:disulfide interchange protein DsbC
MKIIKKIFVTTLLMFPLLVHAELNQDDITKMTVKLNALDPNSFKDVKIKDSNIDGLYILTLNNGNTLYTDKNVTSMVKGVMYTVKNNNLLNKTVQDERVKNKVILKDIISKYKGSMAHYPITGTELKTTVYVFSDFTCPFCKKLHNDIAMINKAGIEVYYIPFPRKSLTDILVVRGLQKILCSSNITESFNTAFRNPDLFVKSVKPDELSCENSFNIMNFNNYGNDLDIKGTPAIFTENGSVIHGYSTVVDFVTELKKNLDEEKIWSEE